MLPKSGEWSVLALNQHRLAVATKFVVVTTVIIIFYFQDLNLVFSNAVSDEATYHILAIPFLFGYLLYRKRKMVNASLKTEKQNVSSTFAKNFTLLVGILLCATAVLHIGLAPTPLHRLNTICLPCPFLQLD